MPDLAAQFACDGFVVFDADPRVTRWATHAHAAGVAIAADAGMQSKWLRHGKTWFVGVDALANAADGSIDGAPLDGPWCALVEPPAQWHPAQLSVVYEGYPKQDAGESDAAHRFRVNRSAAHVDGLHLEADRRVVREPHSFILGLPLNDSDACPLVVWTGSHSRMRAALGRAIGGAVIGADVTQAYKTARAEVFETCNRVEVHMSRGQAVLLDRFAVHGVAAWRAGTRMPAEGRMVAYFRPLCANADDWLLG